MTWVAALGLVTVTGGCSFATRIAVGPPCSRAPPIVDTALAIGALVVMATTSCTKEQPFDECGRESSSLHTLFVVLPATAVLLTAGASALYGFTSASASACRARAGAAPLK